MSFDQVKPEGERYIPNHNDDNNDSSIAYTPSHTTDELIEDHGWFSRSSLTPPPTNTTTLTSSLPVPWPGFTFIIRSVTTGYVVTLLDGQIELIPPGDVGCGSIYWACVETEGWLGFQNTVSGHFLGHDAKGTLCCVAKRHQGWECFCMRMKPEGGCVLLMRHYLRLWHVGLVELEQGEKKKKKKKLAKVAEGGIKGMVWEFIKV